MELFDVMRTTFSARAFTDDPMPDEVLAEIFGDGASDLHLVREELLVNWRDRLVNPMLAASAPHAG